MAAAAPSLLVSLLLLRAVPSAAPSVALQSALLEDAGGSGEAEGPSASPEPPAVPDPGPQPHVGGASAPGPPPPPTFLGGIVDFFRQYVMLIAVVGSLVFLLMFIVCAAVIARQRHKASAYYPSSFPKKKYVHQSDRAGGPRAFSEVPDRAPAGRPEDALDSSRQLQADILAATQNLKSPAKAALGSADGAGKVEDSSEEEARDQAQGRGVPAEPPGPAEELCPAEPTPVPDPGPGDPGAAPSSAQEAGEPAGAPESPCACRAVTPSA